MENKRFPQNKKQYLQLFLSLCIFGAFAVTRLWRLSTIPSGLHVDEASMAYSAWCLAEYGVDWNLKSWPVYFINFGGGQNALYIYCCALLFKIFGFHYLLIRLPGITFSLLNLIFGIKLCKRLWPDLDWMPLAAGALITVCPYFVMASRFGLESSLMVDLSTVFLYFFVEAISRGRTRDYMAAGLTGGLLLYTYALAYTILPLFLLFSIAYTLRVRRFCLKKWALMSAPLFLLAFPLILEQLVNAFQWPELRLGPFTVTRLAEYRTSEISLFRPSLFVTALKSALLGDSLNYNSIPGIPVLFYMTIPLFAVGFFRLAAHFTSLVRKREHGGESFLLLWFLAMLLFESHIESNVNKINGIYVVCVLIALFGAAGLFGLLRPKTRSLRALLPCVLCILYAAEFLHFASYYFGGDYTREQHPLTHFDVTVTEAVDFIEDNPQIRHEGTWMTQTGIFFALSALPSPYELRLWEPQDDGYLAYYHCYGFPEIAPKYNYIVKDSYGEYAQELRAEGFTEIPYGGYSLFYWQY